MAKRRKKAVPLMLFWNRRDQVRFIETVERLCSAVNDLTVQVAELKRRPRRTRPKPPLGSAEEGGASC